MRIRRFGNTGVQVGVVGYGAMALSLAGRPPEDQSRQTLEQLLAAGVSLIDTADTYGLGPHDLHHNERLVASAVRSAASPILVATKGGTRRTRHGWQIDGAPQTLYRAICASYEVQGGASPIPLWQLHWPDPRYSVAEMMRPVQRAVDEKLVRYVGVCNVSVAQIEQAREVVPLVSVQNQYNLWHREAETDGVLEYCERHDLVFLPWRPLGGPELAHRLGEIGPLAQVARERGVSAQRLMVAWHLAKSTCSLPIPGGRHPNHILDCLAAQDVELDRRELARIDAISAADLPRRDRPPAWEGTPPLAHRS
jgi:aryl-alcohol dehydrogenase-like predicted oxidoreductase